MRMSRRADSRAFTFLFSVATAKFLRRPFLTTKVSHIFRRHSELKQRSSSQKMVLLFLVSAGSGTIESFFLFAAQAFRNFLRRPTLRWSGLRPAVLLV